jgi:hypothetical protein
MSFTCELCNFSTNSEDRFIEHLKTHTKEELRKLRDLTKLSIENPQIYEQFLLEMAFLECEKKRKEKENKMAKD